jgi:N-formylmaleamate deformylase
MFEPSTLLYGANLRANGIRQHYLRYGGPRAGIDPVIVVPGITSPAITWGFVANHLGLVLDTYVLDVRGRGLSSASDKLDYSLDAQADDLNAFAAALGLDRYSVLGHSMGARIGIRAARSNPQGMARLALVDPPVSGPGRRPYPSNLSWYVDSLRLSREGMTSEAMRTFCPTWTDDQLALRAEWLHTCDERAVRSSFEGFHTDDIHADLAQLTHPVLLITAARGDVVRDADVDEISALVSDLSHVRVQDAGHMIPWDNEAGFYEALGCFLGTAIPSIRANPRLCRSGDVYARQ